MSIDINIYQMNKDIKINEITYENFANGDITKLIEFNSNRTFNSFVMDLFKNRIAQTGDMDIIKLDKDDINYIILCIENEIMDIAKDVIYVDFMKINDLSIAGGELYEWYLNNIYDDENFERLIYTCEY